MKVSEAISKFLIDNEFNTITYVPGYGGSQIYNELIKSKTDLRMSYHEEVAYTISHSSAICGRRSATLMKTHGLAKAMNAVIDSLLAGNNASFLILLGDDQTGLHSDCIFDAELMVIGTNIDYIRLDITNPIPQLVQIATHSEKIQRPVIILYDTEFMDLEVNYPNIQIESTSSNYTRDISRFLLNPIIAQYQWDYLLFERNQIVQKPELPKYPIIPEEARPHWKAVIEQYAPVFDEFKKIKVKYDNIIVSGETSLPSLFAFPNYNCIDIVCYMGASIPIAIGAYMAGIENVWATSGDFTFISAGHLGLLEAHFRNIPIKILLFQNNIAAATGGQKIDKNLLEHTLAPYKDICTFVDANGTNDEIKNALKKAEENSRLNITIFQY